MPILYQLARGAAAAWRWGWGGFGSPAGTHKGSLWQPDGVQSLRLTLKPPPLTPTPSPHLTWSPCCFHRWSTGRGCCSPPCVGTTPGTLEAA